MTFSVPSHPGFYMVIEVKIGIHAITKFASTFPTIQFVKSHLLLVAWD